MRGPPYCWIPCELRFGQATWATEACIGHHTRIALLFTEARADVDTVEYEAAPVSTLVKKIGLFFPRAAESRGWLLH